LSVGVGKSETIRESLELWKTESESEEKLIKMLITNIRNAWGIFKSRKTPFSKFMKTLESELEQKGLGKLCIQKILDQIKE